MESVFNAFYDQKNKLPTKQPIMFPCGYVFTADSPRAPTLATAVEAVHATDDAGAQLVPTSQHEMLFAQQYARKYSQQFVQQFVQLNTQQAQQFVQKVTQQAQQFVQQFDQQFAIQQYSQMCSQLQQQYTQFAATVQEQAQAPSASVGQQPEVSFEHHDKPQQSEVARTIRVAEPTKPAPPVAVHVPASIPVPPASKAPTTDRGITKWYHKNAAPESKSAATVSDSTQDDEPRYYRSKPCMYFAHGKCRYGDSCRFSHGSRELSITHPTSSDYHRQQERVTAKYYKTRICVYWEQGICSNDKDHCPFAHGEDDLRTRQNYYDSDDSDELFVEEAEADTEAETDAKVAAPVVAAAAAVEPSKAVPNKVEDLPRAEKKDGKHVDHAKQSKDATSGDSSCAKSGDQPKDKVVKEVCMSLAQTAEKADKK